jgi:hypothetical protein
MTAPRKPAARRLPLGIRRIPGYIVTMKCGHEVWFYNCSLECAVRLAKTQIVCDDCRLTS